MSTRGPNPADAEAAHDWHREHPAPDPPGYDPHPDDYAPTRPRPRCRGCDNPWCVTCHYRRTDSTRTQGDSPVSTTPQLEHGVIVDGVPETDYHAHDSLSSTGAKRLIECPADYHWYRTHPQPAKDAFDFGHVAHELILGKGAGFEVIDADDWRTKAAREAKDKAVAERRVPLLRKDFDRATVCATAVLDHPVIGPWFTSDGAAEQSALTTDPDTGVTMRARFDRLTEIDGRPTILDVKTTAGNVHPWRIGKVIADFHYHLSAAFYLRVARACGLDDPDFRLVFVDKTPGSQHEVRAYTLDAPALSKGDEEVATALDLHAQCTAHDEWPCLHPAQLVATLPAYALA